MHYFQLNPHLNSNNQTMKKFPLIILTPIPISGIGIHCEACSGKTYNDSENLMTTISSMNWSKSISNFQATK